MENRSSPERLHGMIMAQSALLFAVIRTTSPERLPWLRQAVEEESEAAMAHMLQSGASDATLDALERQLSAQKAFLDTFRP